MTRGELIDALSAADAQPSPTSARWAEAVEQRQSELEEQLRLSRERADRTEVARTAFADLFSQAPLAYCVIDRNGALEDANIAAATLFCATASALDGAKLAELVTIGQPQMFSNHVERCIGERLRVCTELTMIVRGRGEIAVRVVSSPRVREDGMVDACRTIFDDVTRIRRVARLNEFLTAVDDTLGEACDASAAANAMARACVPMLGDVTFVDLFVDARGALRRAGLAIDSHHDGMRAALVQHVEDPGWHRYVRRVIETNSAVFEPSSAAGFSATIPAKAFVLVPLIARGKPLGVFGALRFGECAYNVDELELLHRLARRTSIYMTSTLVGGANEREEETSRTLLETDN